MAFGKLGAMGRGMGHLGALGSVSAPAYAGSLLDANYVTNSYWYNGTRYADETSLNTAISATKSGITRTLAPKVLGAGTELVTNGNFDTDITGWSTGGSGDTTISWVSGKMQMVRGSNASAGTALQGVLVGGSGRGLRLQVTPSGNAVTGQATNNGGAAALSATALGSTTQQTKYLGSGNAAPAGQINLAFWPTNTSSTASIDGVSLKEVGPLAEHSNSAFAAIIKGTTPATASGNKVAFQADCDNENDRFRVVWDNTKHLRLITTCNGTEQANIDLGVVDVLTPFIVYCSATTNSVRASLNGNGITVDTVARHPGLAYLRIGRSFTGETWDGTIDRVSTFNRVLTDVEMVSADKAFQIRGDSTAAGDGIGVASTEKWWYLLYTAYDPDRAINNSGVSGETTAQMLTRAEADTTHRGWTTIYVDRPNSNDEDWINNIKSAAGLLTTNRWFVLPPVLNSPSGQPDSVATIIGQIQSTLLSDPFFSGHTLDASAQATYIAAMNDDTTRDSGFIHFSAVGQNIQYTTIKAFLDAQGW
jgi:hypothetical protein